MFLISILFLFLFCLREELTFFPKLITLESERISSSPNDEYISMLLNFDLSGIVPAIKEKRQSVSSSNV